MQIKELKISDLTTESTTENLFIFMNKINELVQESNRIDSLNTICLPE